MTPGPVAPGLRTRSATFELERFEWTAPDRLEVVGRWFGVRGLRFMRPALDLRGDDGHHRLLALLEHKPWATEDGEEWIAAFACEDGPVEFGEAELAVAPSVSVELPRARGSRSRQKRSSRSRDGGRSRIAATRVTTELPNNRTLIDAQELREERDAAAAARDEALREREGLVAGRDAAARERDRALGDRERLARERDAAIAARDAALGELESVMRERDEAIAGRKEAMRAAESAAEERDAAKTSLDASIRHRQTLKAQRDAAVRERDELQARLDVAPRSAAAATPAPPPPPPPNRAAAASAPRWTERFLALGLLAILVAGIAVALHPF